MSGVDDRIVSMKFDNAAFERKLSDTIKSLDKLRTSLDFANNAKGFENITAAANAVNLGTIASATDHIAQKFNAMTVVATAAITKLVHSAMTAGANMVKAFAFEPIKQGFQEFETNMNSIQTILANTDSKGTTLEQVNGALDELNHYSDQTIYNFSEMARNIGTFTAAGVDLDKSVSSIKGIANVAAISGSNSQQASTAMYQLSQAIAAGSVKLMDWNSVVNAGMGGEVFQKALFETGKKMGTIANVPMGQTFEQWKDSGNSFRLSLEQGWLTGEVLTETLAGFTGDLTEAQILSMGYTKEQAAEIMRLGELGKESATKVKTLTQLLGTIKESVASGWSATFRTVIGDFEQSKELFTSINNVIGGFVQRSADARNEMLKGWADFGGRTALIEAFKNIFETLGAVFKRVGEAFREIFPKKDAGDLLGMTAAFVDFTEKLQILVMKWLPAITAVFKGVFSVINIVWTVIKGLVGVVVDLIAAFADLGSGGGVVAFFERLGSAVTDLATTLVDGGAINRFFEKISGYIGNAGEAIQKFKMAVVGIFDGFGGKAKDEVEKTSEGVAKKMTLLGGAAEFVSEAWDRVVGRFQGIGEALQNAGEKISEFASGIGQWLADLIKPADFDTTLDAVNVGLLGGLTLLFKRFLDNGINFDFGGRLIDTIKDTFGELTNTLKTMQTDIKAKAIQKIAIAVGILTASVVAMSMIDSAALTKAMVAISVGFGQLVATMTLMDKAGIGTSALKMNGLATSMILMATAMGVLSMAVTNFSQLSWEELAKGLIGVSVGLGAMVVAMKFMSSGTINMIQAGVAMGAIAASMWLLSHAIESFSDMSLADIGTGLASITIALRAIGTAMQTMPANLPITAAGLVIVAGGLMLISEAINVFADKSFGDMASGLGGIAAALVVVGVAASAMPKNLPFTSIGLLILSNALLHMSTALERIGGIDLWTLIKALGGLSIALTIMSTAMNSMTGAVAGAGAMLIASASLMALAGVMKVLGSMSLGEIALALIAMGGAFAVLGAAGVILGPLAPVLMTLGTAMALVAGSFALFGAGAWMVAQAVEAMAKSGVAGAKAFVEGMQVVITALPKLVGSFVKAFGQMVVDIGGVIPKIIGLFADLLEKILDLVIKNVPKIAQAIGAIASAGIAFLTGFMPQFIELGFTIMSSILTGLLNNIGAITTTVIDIFGAFSVAVMENMATIVSAAAGIVLSFLAEIGAHAGEFINAGLTLLTDLLLGITNNLSKVISAAATIITTILTEIVSSLFKITAHGLRLLEAFISGVIDNIGKVVTMVVTVVTKFIDTLGENANRIIESGFKLLTDFLAGIGNNIIKVTDKVGEIATEFVTAMGEQATKLAQAGVDALVDFLEGITEDLPRVVTAGTDLIIAFIEGIGKNAVRLADAAFGIVTDFLNGMAEVVERRFPEIMDAGWNLAHAIVRGIVKGIDDNAIKVWDAVLDLAKKAWEKVKDFFDVFSPSKKFAKLGGYLVEGLAVGLRRTRPATDAAEEMGSNVVDIFKNSVSKLSGVAAEIGDIQPTIAPVLDLTKIREGVRGLDGMMKSPTLVPEVSIARARIISTTAEMQRQAESNAEPTYSGPTEVNFNQTINSPVALSVNDIYRATKSQIAMAKEELEIA